VIISNFLLVQTWGLSESIVRPAWAISTEFAAYLPFPALLGLVTKRTAAPVAAAMLIVLMYVASRTSIELNQVQNGEAMRFGLLDVSGVSLFPMLRCLAGFVLGMITYRLGESGIKHTILARPYAGDITALVTLVLLFVPNSDLLLVPLFALLVLNLATCTSRTARLLGTRPVHWLGLISYSV
jgi:peptidoglycan/LPS O-acetylase OafA/YrhL